MLDTRITLAMEQLFLHPDFPKLAEHVHKLLPVDAADQHGAANRHTRELASAIGDHLNSTRIEGGPDAVPGWLRLGVIEAWIGHCSGTADTCRHSPAIGSPQPVLAAAWRPGVIVCGRCTHLLPPVRNSVQDRTCDGCGHECAGVDADDPIYPSVVQLGSLIFQFGMCDSCRLDALPA
ncbi:hypothetical protein ABT369_39225 [Dactylosporangium sp. NPDC000244]|uniref:hypothetical protein n=1 Tax=Dactylosporangium sp. NPDC000244 TaxID=3154365 RepID=UPI00331A4CB0